MKDPRFCPRCLGGRMRVYTSRRVGGADGQWQQQYLQCTRCEFKESRVIPRGAIGEFFVLHRTQEAKR